ncbi:MULTISPECIES: glycosyltransferase family 2 protein [Snodgrassella]|uniref:glycosyltransferase family 2 protein n=1 Tax=Snodgrassella TaxID=1193515 RepID=UPI001EF42B82|nr:MULTISPECIES: glycosyltransferase family 2 protein [Snodgrassella]MCO6527083.1 glycosyltransferase family 2 protein [Snodgrassella sp.]
MNLSSQLFPIDGNQNIVSSVTKTDGSVAVIMRTQNRPILLARAIESVIQQKYSNWHLYLVNDGGNIRQVNELIELYETDLDKKITVIHNQHPLGMEAASNCGFSQANEEFMVIHDDDDSWDPEFLSETVQFLQDNKSAIAVITNCFVVNEQIQNNIVKQLDVTEWALWRDFIDINNLLYNNVSPPICLLIRMEAAKLVGKFNENLPVLGDWDYLLRLFRVGEIKTLNKKLAYYHHRPNAKCIYGNSVISGLDKHMKYRIEYRNSLVRKALMENQSNFGVLHVLLNDNKQKNDELLINFQMLQETNRFLMEQMNILQSHLISVTNEIFSIKRSLIYFEKRAFPLKRVARKIKEKIRKLRHK